MANWLANGVKGGDARGQLGGQGAVIEVAQQLKNLFHKSTVQR
ncbi:hypothetical protein ALP96_03305 [Pseudomonas savastanoi pv. glycinea]|uniref:Uncharacterized protein n=1 Tax=Pseudomonas savastanoi pv. glycinea TaxID=318 RepID=A0A3M4QKW9_PSESG|nr:hypothetical protein ALQ42_02026 [Pseudomonas savastanoi pv. glycinea]RMP94343.1 hypothetical protein ALQ14_03073 [Pseudomonas savastanoi pv. glycinea]RMQ90982.1 hypothetical protein ALP96_03305 [Pseudomonas savastanoi pv. glycinea]RMR41540.1 hypothetical protein ALP91_01049 [Pseudomonas savastanoi pv. glycinea]